MAERQEMPAGVLLAGVHHADEPIAVMDDRSVLVYANDAFRAMGWEPDELLGRSGLEFVHPDDLDRAIAGLEGLTATGTSVPTPFRMLRGDGAYETLDAVSAFVEHEGRHWTVISFHAVPFHLATSRTLELLAAGAPADEVLATLAALLTEAKDVDATVGITFTHRGERTTVGPLDPVLAGSGPWDGGIRRGETVVFDDLTSVEPTAPAFRRGLELGYVGATFLSVADPGSDEPAMVAFWYRSNTRKPFLDVFFDRMAREIVRLALRLGRERGELEHLARHDPLTGLANRTAFFEALDTIWRGERATDPRTLAIVCLDLDDFKPVNDEHGHDAGDRLLEAVAERFREVVRPADVVARLGGDEFVALCPGVVDGDESRLVASRLVDAATQPFTVGTTVVSVGASAGVAFLADLDRAAARDVLRIADEALYRAKRTRKGSVELTVVSDG